MTTPSAAPLTLDEFLTLPEEKPYREYLRGEVMEKSMPNDLHGIVVMELGRLIGNYLHGSKEGRIGTEVRHAARELGWVYLPDLNIRLSRGVLPQGAVEKAPDFAVEVVSPDDRVGRLMERVQLYLSAGTLLIWILDPIDESVNVFVRGEAPRTFHRGDILDARPALANFSLDLADFFDTVQDEAAELAADEDAVD
jgi:Uma2 family endonuclease